MNEGNIMGFAAMQDLNECIAYVNEKNSKLSYPTLTQEEKESIDTILMNCYRESKIISLSYRDKGKVLSYTGVIERIDLIYKELFLLPKKKISFGMIVGLKEK